MADHFSSYDSFNIPPEFKPMGAWAYFGLSVLFSIPIIGLIFLIVFSFSDANLNRRNFARSYFIAMLFAIIAIAVLLFTGTLQKAYYAVQTGQWSELAANLPWAR